MSQYAPYFIGMWRNIPAFIWYISHDRMVMGNQLITTQMWNSTFFFIHPVYLTNFAFLKLSIELKRSRKLQVWKSGLKWLEIFFRYMYPTDLIHLPPPALHYIYVFRPHNLACSFILFIITQNIKSTYILTVLGFRMTFYQFKSVYEFKVNNNCHVYNSSYL